MNKKGISLAELLAVIVIMGIVAGIATPLIGPILEKQDSMLIEQDAKAVLKALDTYCSVSPDDELCYKNSGVYNPDLNLKEDYASFQKIAPYCKIDIYKQNDNNTYYYKEITISINSSAGYEYFVVKKIACDLDGDGKASDDNEILENYSLQ